MKVRTKIGIKKPMHVPKAENRGGQNTQKIVFKYKIQNTFKKIKIYLNKYYIYINTYCISNTAHSWLRRNVVRGCCSPNVNKDK